MALEEVSWLQGFFRTVRIGLSQAVRKSFCFPRRMAKPTLLPLSLLEDSTVLLRSVASGIYRLIMHFAPWAVPYCFDSRVTIIIADFFNM